MQIKGLVQSLRPKQWSKNLIIFAGLIFSANFLHFDKVLISFAAFVIFCFLSGGVYLLNDILDVEKDRMHPIKSSRPIASGALKISHAAILAGILIAGSLAASYLLQGSFFSQVEQNLDLGPVHGQLLQPSFFLVALSYVALMTLYTFALKNVVVLDVMTIAIGFVLRAVAGAVVISVPLSSWLLICTVFLSLFLALCKRRHEIALLDENASDHRKTLSEYDAYLLDQMIAIVSAACIMAYALYTVSEETVAKFHTQSLLFTVVFVVYGMFRYLYLVHKKDIGGDPTMALLTDVPILANVCLWGLICLIIIYIKRGV
ncbi:decaprenyl-phosphate phosphoribosyltransferase [Acidobacteriota bacterium]